MNLQEIKAKYPAYANIPDQELADKIYDKHYASKLGREDYYKKIGFAPNVDNSIGHGIKQGFQEALPRALDFIKGGAAGLYDIAGGNTPESEHPFTDALRQIIGMQTQNEKEHNYQPNELARDVAAGLTSGVRTLASAPGNAINYLGKQLYGDLPGVTIPDLTLPESINNFDVNEFFGANGNRPANEFVQGAAGFLPSLLASGGNPYVAQALHSTGRGENPLTDVLAGALLHGGAKAAPVAARGAKNAIKNAPELVEKVIPERYSQQKTATKAKNMTQEFADYFKKGYNESLSVPGLPEHVEVDVNPRLLNKYKKAAPKHSNDVKKAVKTGDLRDIHAGASQLGRFIDKEYKSVAPNYEAIANAEKLKTKFENTLDETLSSVPEAQEMYRALDAEYESTLGRINPRIRRELREFSKDKLSAEDVMRLLRAPETGKYFRHRFGEDFPGIEHAKHKNSLKNVPVIREGVNFYEKHLGKNK